MSYSVTSVLEVVEEISGGLEGAVGEKLQRRSSLT